MTTRPRTRTVVLVLAAFTLAAAFTSVGGAATAATAPSLASKPVVSGTPRVGSTLTTTSGSWNSTTTITFTYKWLSCDSNGANCTAISGATDSTYVPQPGDAGRRLRSEVTATNSSGSTAAQSDPTAAVDASGNAPANTALPTISGTPAVGATLTSTTGTWTGTTPITYAYDWRRCDAAGGNCARIGLHSDNQTYVPVAADQGHALRVAVTAVNSIGQAQVVSGATGAVGAPGGPVNTALPVVTGTPAQGQTLTTSNGTWTSATTVSYAYQWQRCDSTGNNCSGIADATSSTYALGASDVGHEVRSVVKATNSVGSALATSAAVGPVTSGPSLPAGAVKLPNGDISVPASSIPDSDRLTVSSVTYSPAAIHGKSPISMTVKVIDQNKYVVSGVLVYVLPVPSDWASKAPETPTGQNGTVSVTVIPTVKAPKRGSLVLFVRARTPQGNLLAGSSTRRLVSVRIFGS